MAQAMVTSSLMHASILSSGKSYVDEEAEAEFMHQCLHFAALYEVGHKPPAPKRTFEQHWATRCEADWRWAFRMFAAGAWHPRAAPCTSCTWRSLPLSIAEDLTESSTCYAAFIVSAALQTPMPARCIAWKNGARTTIPVYVQGSWPSS